MRFRPRPRNGASAHPDARTLFRPATASARPTGAMSLPSPEHGARCPGCAAAMRSTRSSQNVKARSIPWPHRQAHRHACRYTSKRKHRDARRAIAACRIHWIDASSGARAQHDAPGARGGIGSRRFHGIAQRLQACQIAVGRGQPADRQHRERAAIALQRGGGDAQPMLAHAPLQVADAAFFAAPELAIAPMQAACGSSRGS